MAKGKSNKNNNRSKTLKQIEEIEDTTSLKTKMIIILCVVIFLGLFYLLAIHITNKNSNIDPNENNNTNNNNGDYSEILLGSTFNRSESEYLVLYYDKNNTDISSTLSTSSLDYTAKDDNLTLYTVDMSNMYNKSYNTEEEPNRNPSNVDELRINGPTLIKISKGSVVEYIEGLEAIKDYLGQ